MVAKTERFLMTLPKPIYDRLSNGAKVHGVSIQNRIRRILELERMDSQKNIECPECHFTWYKIYEDEDDDANLYVRELPVAVRTSFGYLCRLCRYEWTRDGTPVEQEYINRSIASTREAGKRNYAEIQSSR